LKSHGWENEWEAEEDRCPGSHLKEVSRAIQFIEMEWNIADQGWRKCLMETEFQFGKMKKSRRWTSGDGCTTV
jgi:hypothetical protein